MEGDMGASSLSDWIDGVRWVWGKRRRSDEASKEAQGNYERVLGNTSVAATASTEGGH